MIKVKTFTSEVKIFATKKELDQLDERVNQFLANKGIGRVVSVSDACTTDNTGATIGLVRCVAYEEA